MSNRPARVKRTPTGSASSLGIFWTSCSLSPSSSAVVLIGRAHVVVLAESSRIVVLTGGVRVLARIWGLRVLDGDTRIVGGALVGRGDRGIGSDELSQHRYPTVVRVIAALPRR